MVRCRNKASWQDLNIIRTPDWVHSGVQTMIVWATTQLGGLLYQGATFRHSINWSLNHSIVFRNSYYINGLMQKRRNSNALAMELILWLSFALSHRFIHQIQHQLEKKSSSAQSSCNKITKRESFSRWWWPSNSWPSLCYFFFFFHLFIYSFICLFIYLLENLQYICISHHL